MAKEITKSSELLRQEAELEELRKEYKKVRKNLKSNTTRLNNDRKRIAEIQMEVAKEVGPLQMKMMEFQEQYLEKMEKMRASKKVPKREKIIS